MKRYLIVTGSLIANTLANNWFLPNFSSCPKTCEAINDDCHLCSVCGCDWENIN